MRKFDMRKMKIRRVSVDQISEKLLLVNLYATQIVTLIIGIVWILLQGRNPLALLRLPDDYAFVWWGGGLALAVLLVNWAISSFVPEEAADDGGINEKIFARRPVWHIAVLSLVVSLCEEMLFRGAVQHAFGPYWTSILFAAIHVRYLRHWIPTGLVFSISYGLGWIMEIGGTIWAPVAAHWIIDFALGLAIRFRRNKT